MLKLYLALGFSIQYVQGACTAQTVLPPSLHADVNIRLAAYEFEATPGKSEVQEITGIAAKWTNSDTSNCPYTSWGLTTDTSAGALNSAQNAMIAYD
jgi:hypothetical protein